MQAPSGLTDSVRRRSVTSSKTSVPGATRPTSPFIGLAREWMP